MSSTTALELGVLGLVDQVGLVDADDAACAVGIGTTCSP
jgi:hypothetical protein